MMGKLPPKSLLTSPTSHFSVTSKSEIVIHDSTKVFIADRFHLLTLNNSALSGRRMAAEVSAHVFCHWVGRMSFAPIYTTISLRAMTWFIIMEETDYNWVIRKLQDISVFKRAPSSHLFREYKPPGWTCGWRDFPWHAFIHRHPLGSVGEEVKYPTSQ